MNRSLPLLLVLTASLLAACGTGAPPGEAAVIAHGGAGSPVERSLAVLPAAQAALQSLNSGADTLHAAVAGATVLEDDPTFNAGTGANVRLDGITVQMDAAVMDSMRRFGAVAGIERVKNPIQVALAVIGTPHSLIVGDGATAFARALGFPDYDPTTPARRAKRDRAVKTLLGKGDTKLPPGWETFDWKKHYAYERKLRDAGLESFDTIGVLVRGADGSFGGALSTGGTTLTLRGRAGDVPIYGAGLYVGPEGAVACTGNGEDIIREMLARRVYERMTAGGSPEEAIAWGVSLFPENVSVGLIAMNRRTEHAGANRSMAWAVSTAAGDRMPTTK